METYIFQHVEYEGPGAILPYLEAKGHNVHVVRLYAGDKIPHEDEVDFAILMGGPMSVLEETEYPYFVREKELCRDMVQLGKPILGICLGAQMIANAFGAAIRKNPEKEIGWFPVSFDASVEGGNKVLDLPKKLQAFHWHGETFDIPEAATSFASSEACKNQAFKLGSAIALQFHVEVTDDSMESMLKNGAEEIEAGLSAGRKFVQSAAEIKKASSANMDKANKALIKILDFVLKK
ncbi:MAG: type 1 glutamine amidotransferase [Fibrobacter sp.]|nr:type 1 glutamine amidotransferase [Fibrobacter sp.]